MKKSNPRPATIEKYTKYMNGISAIIFEKKSLHTWQNECGVSNNTVTALKNLGMLTQIAPGLYRQSKPRFDNADVLRVIREVNNLGVVSKLKKDPESVKAKSIEPQTVKDMSAEPVKHIEPLKVESAKTLKEQLLSDYTTQELVHELKKRGFKGNISKAENYDL